MSEYSRGVLTPIKPEGSTGKKGSGAEIFLFRLGVSLNGNFE